MYSSRGSFTSERIQRGKKESSFLKFFVGGLILIIFVVYYSIVSVGNTLVKEDIYRIGRGDTVRGLNEKLDLPISSWKYTLWLKYFAPEVKSLQIGEYRVSESITLESFFRNTLSKPIHIDQTITILPGWNIYDIDTYLSDNKILKTGDFLSEIGNNYAYYEEKFDFLRGKGSLEGFLYPDTYRIRRDATAQDIIQVLLRQFEKTIGPSYRELGDTAYQTLILASIVEREERSDKEQSIVAGILSKRVKEGIPMGADATVCTGYAKTQKQCTPSFIGEVIGQKHPFNTRNRQGYPPTPIANVPLSVWKNTRAKIDSPYYYYLHDSDGVIHYAKDLEGHVANKNQYLK